MPDRNVAPPSILLLALEGRAWIELAALIPSLPLLAGTPRGDGHPVLVIPGYLASDRSTRALRAFLRQRGYHVNAWRLGLNLGPSPRIVAGLDARLRELRVRHGRTVRDPGNGAPFHATDGGRAARSNTRPEASFG